MKQKFILELNGALAMENAGIERLQVRIAEFLKQVEISRQINSSPLK
jgi:hypothetical protein